MSLERFDAHLSDPAPGFRCYACGAPSEKLDFLARVENVVGKRGSAPVMGVVSRLCSDISALKHFVERHDGVLLYRDKQSEAGGIAFFSALEWPSRTQEMRESMTAMGFAEDDMPDWFHRGIVFGQIPRSGNYFVIQLRGAEAGKVFYCDHDDFRTEAIAQSFECFLNMIVDNPPEFLHQCGCYTRYSDGKTNTQWIPKEYVADIAKLAP